MENMYEQLLREIERGGPGDIRAPDTSASTAHTEPPTSGENEIVSGRQIWLRILAASDRVPPDLRNAFLAQVLISIFETQSVTLADLKAVLRTALEGVERVRSAKETEGRAA